MNCDRIANDWYPGTIPTRVWVDLSAHVATSSTFRYCQGQSGATVALAPSAALYDGAVLVLGPHGEVRLGEYALMASGTVFSEVRVELGSHAMVAWEAVIMDSYLLPLDPEGRRAALTAAATDPCRSLPASGAARPISIGKNVWIGFGACILPGVRIGEGAVVGARAVVVDDVPPFTLVAGNPARVVRILEPSEPRCSAVDTVTPATSQEPAADRN